MGMRNRIRAVGVAIACAAALVACGSSSDGQLRGYQSPTDKSSADVFVTDASTGRPMELRADNGELLVVYFGYTRCPDICPTTLVAVKNAKKRLGEDSSRIDLAMITVDPDRDTPDVLPKYLSSFTDKFHALVPATDQELRRAENAFDATSSVTVVDGKVEVVHGGTCYVVDPEGRVVDEFPFGMDAESMAHDLKILLKERETQQ
jgi:protein SCO1/2